MANRICKIVCAVDVDTERFAQKIVYNLLINSLFLDFNDMTNQAVIPAKTLLIGASTNPERYSFKAAHSLHKHGHEIVLLGLKAGQVAGQSILTERPVLSDIDTVTLYIGPQHQADWYDYVLNLKPRRVIFNPGTENAEFEALLLKNNIEASEACTLVLLSIGAY